MKATVSFVMNEVEKRARQNDSNVSLYEDQILNALAELNENADRLVIYRTILKEIYKDGYLEKDEADILEFCKSLLKIKPYEHQKALMELKFI